MKRLMIVIAAMAVLVPTSLWAQDPAKAEVFGGFSVLHLSNGGVSTTPVGWQGALAFNLNPKMGIVGDFGGHYKDGGSMHSYLGGLRYNHRADKMTPFVHGLMGGNHISSGGGGGSANGFSMAFGGGLDYTANEKINIRVVQFDWMPTRYSAGGVSAWQNNTLRFGFGLVFRAGS
jgi:hypothetical protein